MTGSKALDAAKDATGDEGKRLRAVLEDKLAAVLEQRPNLSKATLEKMVSIAYKRWVKAQA